MFSSRLRITSMWKVRMAWVSRPKMRTQNEMSAARSTKWPPEGQQGPKALCVIPRETFQGRFYFLSGWQRVSVSATAEDTPGAAVASI